MIVRKPGGTAVEPTERGSIVRAKIRNIEFLLGRFFVSLLITVFAKQRGHELMKQSSKTVEQSGLPHQSSSAPPSSQ